MRSSSNQYLSRLDHLRAFAALQVFLFHFSHQAGRCGFSMCNGQAYVPLPPFAVFEQGGSGVAFFMCISGYIFSYLIHDQPIRPLVFVYNRLLRVVPLLLFWDLVIYLFYARAPITGTWSIYIELQFYAVYPVLLMYLRWYGPKVLVFLLPVFFIWRLEEWFRVGSTAMELGYYSLAGRADQLLCGSLAFHVERWIRARPDSVKLFRFAGITGVLGAVALSQYFSLEGGMASYPPDGFYWVISPLIDAICYSLFLMFYLQLFIAPRWDRFLSAIGRWSYSLYLGQFFFIPAVFYFSMRFGLPITTNFYLRFLLGILLFLAATPLAFITYRLIEKPFLKFRKSYILPAAQADAAGGCHI